MTPATGHGSCPPSLETRRRKDGEELAQGLVTLPFLSCSEPCSVRSPLPGPAPPTAHEGAPVPTEGSPACWHLPQRPVHTRAPGGGEHGADRSSPEPSLPAGKCPRVAQESGTNASLGGGLLRAPRRLVLMVFTSCVSVQQKTRDAACLLPLSSALSLPLQTLDLNLLRIQHRGRRQRQQRQPAQPRGHRSLKMHHPACWIVFSVTTALLFIPGVPVRSGDATFPKAMDNVTVRQGESATLRCTIDDRVTRVAWLNRSTILYAGNDKWSIDPRVIILVNTPTQYSIMIQNVDVYDEGPYTCSVQTDNHPKTSRVHLIVQVPPQIMNISSDVTVNEGSSVTLLCLAIGRPEPTVTWRHLSVKDGQGFVSEDEYLEISDIKRDQSGEYECSALNDVAAPDVRKVKITVNYPPYISKARNTGVSVGQKGILSCEASAVPMAEFQWFKEDTRLATGLDGLRIENRGHISTLTFFNVSEKDYGNYTCVATNKLGNTNASITLYGPGAVIDGVNSASRALACLWLSGTLFAHFFIKF